MRQCAKVFSIKKGDTEWAEKSTAMTATFIMLLFLNVFIVFPPLLLKRSPKRVR